MKPEINVCDAPYYADPSGHRDSTDAIVRALDDIVDITWLAYRQGLAEVEDLPARGCHYHLDGCEPRRVEGKVDCGFPLRLPFVPTLYFPEGVYRVSDTLVYSRRDFVNTNGRELNQQIRIRGAGLGRSVIRLQDGARGFGPGSRKPLLSNMRGTASNVAMSNYCEDLTIHCGSGNPGAVGLDFFANNSGAVRNLHVLSGDGKGHAGIVLGHSAFSGILVEHVEIDGFDHGLHVHSDTGCMYAHLEDISTRNQHVSGVTVGAISASIRKLQTENVPAGLTCTDPVGFTALIDSDLRGNGPVAIDRQNGFLYVSNVTTHGFGDGRNIDEWVYPALSGSASMVPRLPIEKAPVRQHRGGSTGVRPFGAIGNGINDDSPAIQRAMDSGAVEIRFEPGRYLLNSPVTIPSHVEHINFDFCDLVAGIDLKQSDREGFRIVGSEADNPLFIERILAWLQWSGTHCTFTHAGTRTVCFKDLHTQTLPFYRNTVPGGRVFFDNVASTTGVIPGTTDHGRCAVILRGQKAWARQLNPERGEPMILNDGGDLVLLGYKSEGTGATVHTINGGRTEVIGGAINIGKPGDVAFVGEYSQMRISTVSHGWIRTGCHRNAIRESRDGKERTIASTDMPARGFDESRGPQYAIPLFCSNPNIA